LISYGQELQKIKNSKQNSLFGGQQISPPEIPIEVKSMPEWDESLLLSYEKDALGFYITGHPLTQFGKRLEALISHNIADLDDERDFNNEIRLAGIIAAMKPLKTKKDERMATFILEDLSSRIEVVVFPDNFQKYFDLLREDQQIWMKGRFLGEGDSRRVHLLHVSPLADAFQNQAKRVVLRIFLPGTEESLFAELKSILERNEGECPVYFELETPHSYRMLVQSVEIQGVTISKKLTEAVESLLGEAAVHIEY
jgi:DNA polymerase-3 subunit alpha